MNLLHSSLVNVLVIFVVLVGAYAIGHLEAVRKARRFSFAEPAFFDYEAHRALWAYGVTQRKGVWYWLPFVLLIVLVDVLTAHIPFGFAIAAAALIGLIARPLFLRIGQGPSGSQASRERDDGQASGRPAWLVGSPRRAIAVLGATLVVGVVIANVIETINSPHGQFDHGIRVLLGAFVITGIVLILIASVWTAGHKRRPRRPDL